MRRQAGVVLLTTILMISILTLLVLTLLQGVFLYLKVINQAEIGHRQFYQLEAAAKNLLLSPNWRGNNDCQITETDPGSVLSRLQSHQACLFSHDNHSYYFLLQDLGVFPCLQIGLKGSHQWLISLMNEEQVILQLRIAEAIKTVQCEGRMSRKISEMVSWRYLFFKNT